MKISIIGAGGWGTALAVTSSANNDVTLWAYSEEETIPLSGRRENPDYLPGVKIPAGIRITADVNIALDAQIMIFTVPSKFMRATAGRFIDPQSGRWLDKGTIIVSAAKGFEFPSEKRMSEVLGEVLRPEGDIVVISGPSHAEEVARGVPTSIVAASGSEDNARTVQAALSTDVFRLYRNTDVLGVETAGAVKNVIALAAGILRGLGLGDNTMAALLTRGLAEMKRLGMKLGAREDTFTGLAGMGDLIVTCVSAFSRNGRVGEELAKGRPIEEIVSSMKMVAEGVETVKTVIQMEHELGIEMPISHAVYDILEKRQTPAGALKNLMSRPLKEESK